MANFRLQIVYAVGEVAFCFSLGFTNTNGGVVGGVSLETA